MRLSPTTSRVLSVAGHYGIGVGLVALAAGFHGAIFSLIGTNAPFVLLLLPTVIASWYGGLGPGVLAAVLAYLVGIYFFLEPYGTWSFTAKSGTHAVVFGVECAVMTTITLVARAGYMRTRATARRMTAMNQIGGALGSTVSVDDVAAVILDEAIRVLSVDAIVVYTRPDENGPLHLQAILGRDPGWLPLTELGAIKDIPLDADAAVALAARTRDVVAFETQEQFGRQFPKRFEQLRAKLPNALLCAPMLVHDRTLGVLVMGWSHSRRIAPDDRQWALGVAHHCASAVERTQLFEAERCARIRAESASRAQESFFSSVSGQLRSPLTSVLSWVHTLRKGRPPRDRDRYFHALDTIERTIEGQSRLVDDVIEMSRAGSHRLRVDVKSAKVKPLMRSWLDEVRPTAAEKRVSLDLGARDDAAVSVDIRRLRLAMHKVLLDAIEASREGGRVSLSSERHDGRVYLSVRREGASAGEAHGKPPPPTSNGDGSGGTEKHLGLNLAIANVVVQQHGGTLAVDSGGPDRGPAVTLDLPAVDPRAGLLATAAPEPSASQEPLAGARVLLVDDDGGSRETLAEVLASDGAEVRSEPSAQSAMAALNEFSPTVIVSAVRMSGQDGYAFMRAVRALKSPAASTPALALTPIDDRDERAALDAGFQEHLAKPPHPQELSETVAQMHASSGAH
jgi:K+-sensing histidine kinase KdpD/ActR/RegA family two-component response regulator